MSPKVGRPQMDNADKRLVRLEIRLNNEENELLKELSEKLGLTKTETIIKGIRLLAKKK